MSQGLGPDGRPTTASWPVDDEGMTVPASLDQSATYDVLLNEQHVWSLLPTRDVHAEHGEPVARWPEALLPHLRGRAEVTVREHLSGEVLSATRHTFGGDASREVSVVDRGGRPLIIDKWGRLTRPMSLAPPGIQDELLDAAVRILDVLREKAGVASFVAYGTLLGAVRNGRLIGHDNDIDLAYLSEHPHPVDVVREGFRIERVLRDEGFLVRRGSGVRLNIRLRLSDNSPRAIDVFTAHWVEGRLYIPSDTGFKLPRETILPLTTVELLGRQVPAPAQPEVLLEATYGEGWRVPDPSFQYHTPRWLSRRLNGWFGGLIIHRKHWDGFYAKERDRVPRRPSPFARWVAQEYPSDRPLVDVGSGTGRDGLWFARTAHRPVTGMDYNIGVVKRSNKVSRRRRLPATFRVVNLYDTRAVLAWGALLSREPEPVDLYARFVLHALEDAGQANLLRLASMSLRRGGLLFLEFRTPRDRGRPHAFGEHRRNYQTPARVRSRIEAAGGHVLREVSGTGLAPFKGEDPHVCRMVVSWSQPG